jgi:hypothetical protein
MFPCATCENRRKRKKRGNEGENYARIVIHENWNPGLYADDSQIPVQNTAFGVFFAFFYSYPLLVR